MDIGNIIKKYRESANISQEELANKLYVSRQTISNWETNKSYPDIKSITMLSNIFDVSLDEFIKGDIDKMKSIVNESDINGFKILSYIYLVEYIVMIVSIYPLFKYAGIIGIAIWILFVSITITTAFIIERFKKHYNIQTYKEIIAFYENKTLTRDEKNIEFGKRNYQKIILAICSALLALIVLVIMNIIFR